MLRTEMIGRLVEAVIYNGTYGKVKSAVKYYSPRFVIKATRHGKTNTVAVTLGKPNYAERAFIKKALKAGEPFPIKKIQLQFVKAR